VVDFGGSGFLFFFLLQNLKPSMSGFETN